MELVIKQKVNASISGSDECLSMVGTFQLVQNAITELMGKLHIDGITVKNKYNAFWVFVKTKIKILNKIIWGEEITISSFISEITNAKLCIDVKATNTHDVIVFYSKTELCALDRTSLRIRRTSTVGVDEAFEANQSVIDIIFNKIDTTNLKQVDKVRVKSTNIDMSHHTNNVEYIRFIMDTYSISQLEEKMIKEIYVNFTGQSYEGDVLDILKVSNENKDVIELQKDNKSVIKCEITY